MRIEELKNTIAARRSVLAERFKVSEIGVFGSYVRGEDVEGSDVDMLVAFSAPVGLFAFLELEEYLEGVLGRKVDLVTKKALKPRIGQNILREVVML